MSRLNVLLIFYITIMLTACERDPICSSYNAMKNEKDISILLKEHDEEIKKYGKDICYGRLIGSFGKKGFIAVLNHIISKKETIYSYNNTSLIFEVAVESKIQTGYDICQDQNIINKIEKMSQDSSGSSYELSTHESMKSMICRIH